MSRTAGAPVALQIKNAAGGAQTLGVVLALLGALVCVPSLFDTGAEARILGALAGLLLLGPGIMDLFAAGALRRGNRRPVVMAIWTAIGQCAAVILWGAMLVVFGSRDAGMPLIIPGTLLVFFTPACLAMAFELRGALAVLWQIGAPGHGFEAVVRPVELLPDQAPAPNPIIRKSNRE